MLIKKIVIKNFKSFGNNENELKFSDKGELILLMGKNGAGKSSLLETIDYSLFGKVRGKKKKYISNSSLPNRFNNNLETNFDFEVGDHKLNVIRGINPNKLELRIDGERLDRSGKSNIQDKIEEFIGIDIDTFKSFISMSVNDFKNFMTLTPDEKRMLLDKLFNLDMINGISVIIKEKKKQNKHEVNLYNREYNTYSSSLDDFKQSIEKVKSIERENNKNKLHDIKELISSKKDLFKELNDRIIKGEEKNKIIYDKLITFKQSIAECNVKISEYDKRIKLFEKGICPVCESDLTSDTKQSYKNMMIVTMNKTTELRNQFNSEIIEWSSRETKLKNIIRETQNSFSELKAYLNQLRSNIKDIEEEDIPKEEQEESIDYLLESLKKIEKKKEISESKLSDAQEESDIIDQLSKLFSEEGIKKSIIAKIVVPINHFIDENMKMLNLPFVVSLDEQFSANIFSFGQEIEVDTLSSGETKLVNMAILVAYLKLIRTKKNINILFLDEVFSTIDLENIYLVLGMFKDFAYEYNVNIFLVHHAMLEKSSFDRIIRIEKDITSQILEGDDDDDDDDE